jgi:energy-coupling factor transporter ATP-binding protein EcfA2
MPAHGDNPIPGSAADLLGRLPVARNLAAALRDADASEGYVVAVTGPWGSGKTSLLNMVREELVAEAGVTVVEFNPWMFSGANQLVESFFQELAAQLDLKGDRLTKIASEMEAYGDLLSPLSLLPFVGGWLNRAKETAGAFARFRKQRRGSVNARREILSAALSALDRPIVVVVDDIDRLETGDIRDVFKLVRLTASFPNVMYVLAFDRGRVEQALTTIGFDGRVYLEKIVQLTVSVPAVPRAVLLRQLGEAIEDAVNDLGVTEAPFAKSAWPDVLAEIVLPLVGSMRDVRRYAAAVRTTVRVLDGEVELVDVLGLEAVRVFLPASFDVLSGAPNAFTTPMPALGSRGDDDEFRETVERFLDSGASSRHVLRAVVVRLFPAAARHVGSNAYGDDWLSAWLRGRRVAHPDVLATYLEHSPTDQLVALREAECLLALSADADAVEAGLRALDPERLPSAISMLSVFEEDVPADSVVPIATALLNVMADVVVSGGGMVEADGSDVVVPVLLRVLRRLDGPERRGEAAAVIVAGVRTLWGRLELLRILGYGETGSDDPVKLAPEAVRTRLAEALVEQIKQSPPEELAAQPKLIRLLLAPKHLGVGGILRLPAGEPRLAFRLLSEARTAVRTQMVGSRAVHRAYRLQWDTAVEMFGGEDNLRAAVDTLRAEPPDNPDWPDLLALVDKYLGGWRPREF